MSGGSVFRHDAKCAWYGAMCGVALSRDLIHTYIGVMYVCMYHNIASRVPTQSVFGFACGLQRRGGSRIRSMGDLTLANAPHGTKW